MIAIIDYGSGNVGAISNIYTQLRIDHQITADHQQIKDASHIILAGVGSFDFTMNSLNQSGLTGLLKELAAQGRPIMGICVGMQILGQSSEEGELEGLGFIEGEVKKIDESLLQSKLKLPHMGWNSISPTAEQPIFEGVDTQRGFFGLFV